MKKNAHCAEVIIPHAIHLGMSVALIVMTAEILKKVCHIHRGLKKIHEGRKEIAEGRKEILGKK